MTEQTQQVALVTGATSGMGLEIATTLARQGIAVYLCSRRHDAVAATVKGLQDQGLDVNGSSCDVRSLEQIQQYVRAGVERFGPIDILVNNAGRPGGGNTSLLADELWCDVIDTNLTSVFRMTKEVLTSGGMLERGCGRIINIASTGGKQGVIHAAPYSASKHGVVGFSKALGLELAKTGITVNAVCPDSSRLRWPSECGSTTPPSGEWTRPKSTPALPHGCQSAGTSSPMRWPQWSST